MRPVTPVVKQQHKPTRLKSVLQTSREEALLRLKIQLRPAFEDSRFLVSCTLHLSHSTPPALRYFRNPMHFHECEYLTLDSICFQKMKDEHISSQSYVIFYRIIVLLECMR